jgi:hypothetical protein
LRHSRKLDSLVINVLNVTTFTGEKQKKETLVVILSSFIIDFSCIGKYEFIGRGCGIGRNGKKITYAEAWKGFERSLTSARIPCTSIERYPVVARWRADVDYVAAGIFCFQPYCVTGELDPPANPLICPQFCVRFNDLDNIGKQYLMKV